LDKLLKISLLGIHEERALRFWVVCRREVCWLLVDFVVGFAVARWTLVLAWAGLGLLGLPPFDKQVIKLLQILSQSLRLLVRGRVHHQLQDVTVVRLHAFLLQFELLPFKEVLVLEVLLTYYLGAFLRLGLD